MTTQVRPQDKTVTVNGLKLHYLDWGAVGKPTMVLLHGLRGHAHSWDDVSTAVCRDYHVLALDQRGRGDSEWAKDADYSTMAYVTDLAAFCDALKLDPIILVGHSMGGQNSVAFAARYQRKLSKLIVVDVGPVIDPRGAERIRRETLEIPEEFTSFEAVVEHMSVQNCYASDTVMRRRLKYATRTLPDGKVGWSYDVAIRDQRRRGTAPPPVDLWPLVHDISCPTLIVRGADSDILSPEVAQQMVSAMPNARLVEVQRAGHMVFEDNPDDFLAVVRIFLT